MSGFETRWVHNGRSPLGPRGSKANHRVPHRGCRVEAESGCHAMANGKIFTCGGYAENVCSSTRQGISSPECDSPASHLSLVV